MNSKEKELQDISGIHVSTWSPGDGVTRYRFFVNTGNSCFGPENGIYTALGFKEAMTFAKGFGKGWEFGEKGKGSK